ncbi:MAG: hypothetical protein R6X23_07575 [Acidimicrobiia bacterium]
MSTEGSRPGAASTASDGYDSGRAAWWFAAGAALAGVVFLWALTAGSFDLFGRQRFAADFYDVQAHRLLEGHLSMPGDVLLIEAFSHGGRDYMYFGPTPALLRLPIALVTDQLDGRLTQLSMLLAFAVAMTFVGRLFFRARDLVRPGSPWTRLELVGTAAAAFMAGAGSSILFLGSRPWVYHEASIWGLALALGAFLAILDIATRPSRSAVVSATALTALALLARPPLGAGPLLALGLVAVVAITQRLRPAVGTRLADISGLVPTLGRFAIGIAIAVVVPVALYAGVNQAKFGNPVSIPFDRQAQNAVDPNRQAVLAANGGTLINVAAAPTTILAYARPDTVRVSTTFPFVSFREQRATVIGDVTFDLVDRVAGMPVTMPSLVIASIVGIFVVFRRGRREPRGVSAWRLPLVGAACGVLPTLVIVYVAQRYTADFMPVLLLSGVVGVHWLVRAIAGRSPRWRRGIATTLVVLAVWGVWTNVSLAYEFRHAYAPLTSAELRADRAGTQLEIADALGTGGPSFDMGRSLPASARAGDLFALEGCSGLYWYDGEDWLGVERTNRTGGFRLEVTRDGSGPLRERVLIDAAGPLGAQLLLRPVGDEGARLVLDPPGSAATTGRPFTIGAGETVVLDAVLDEVVGEVIVSRDGGTLLGADPEGLAALEVRAGRRAGTTVRNLPMKAEVCRRLATS